MATTFEKIATATVGSGGAAYIEFTPIAGDWTDLALYVSTRTTASAVGGNDIISLNGSSSSFSGRRIYGAGSGTPASDTITTWAGFNDANNATASTFGNSSIYFPNYAGSTNKSYSIDTVSETNGTTTYMGLAAGLWSNTAAITTIRLTPDSGNYAQYSTATLYGIKKA
jgi:hypothetical protein